MHLLKLIQAYSGKKNEKMGKNLSFFKCRLQKVALLLSCLALCPQLGNQTIWFQTYILNMHIFNDLDFSHYTPTPIVCASSCLVK